MTATEYNKAVDLYADGLYRFVLKNIKDEDEARDIVQDTFEKVWMKAETIQADKAKPYLFTTAYHAVIERSNKIRLFSPIEDNHESLIEQFAAFDVKKILNEAVELLPADQKSVLLLRDYEGYSYKEIAEITSLSESQVKVYIFRARSFLKNYIVSADNLV
ncbi:MAG: RNA polymerase sigma factor [Flavobacteriales bacterium]